MRYQLLGTFNVQNQKRAAAFSVGNNSRSRLLYLDVSHIHDLKVSSQS